MIRKRLIDKALIHSLVSNIYMWRGPFTTLLNRIAQISRLHYIMEHTGMKGGKPCAVNIWAQFLLL